MVRKSYSREFKQESAALVLDQGYTHQEACTAVGVGATAMSRWVSQLQAERGGQTSSKGKALTDEHVEILKLKKQIKRLDVEKDIFKKGDRVLDVRHAERYALIDTLSAEFTQADVLRCFSLSRSSYQSYRVARDRTNPERERLSAEVGRIHRESRNAAGTRTILGTMKAMGESIGRCKVLIVDVIEQS